MLTIRNPMGEIELYRDNGQYIGVLPPDHPGYERISRKSLRLTARDEEIWRTTEEGKHFKFESSTGEIKAGFGGKFNGKRLGSSWKPVTSTKAPGKTDYSPDVIKAASGAKNHVEFWMNLPKNEQEKFKTGKELEEFYDRLKADRPDAFVQSEWKPTNGSVADFPKNISVPKVPEIVIAQPSGKNDTRQAHAEIDGVMEIIPDNWDILDGGSVSGIIAHEAGHNLSNHDPDLAQAVMSNYGDVFGRYNQERGYFEGIYGQSSPEEAWAQGWSEYYNRPEIMKQRYPEAYSLYDGLAKSQPELLGYISGTVNAAKRAMADNIREQISMAGSAGEKRNELEKKLKELEGSKEESKEEQNQAKKDEWRSNLEKKMEKAMSWQPDRQAEFLHRKGFLDYDSAVQAMEDGTAGAQMEKYFAIQLKNGSTQPDKNVTDQRTMTNRLHECLNNNGGDWTAARREVIGEVTGQTGDELANTYKQMQTWFGGGWGHADTDTLDRYIDQDGACKGPIYRGLSFSEDDYQSFMKSLKPGSQIDMRGMNSSWSTDKEVAWGFSRGDRSVIITCAENRTAAPVDFASEKGEGEVLAHSRARWTVLGVQEGNNRTEITVIETGEFMSLEDRDRLKREHANDSLPERSENIRQISLAQRMREQSKNIRVVPESVEFAERLKEEYPI